MPLYRYVKSTPARRRIIRSRRFSFVLMGLGALILFWTVWPIVSFSTVSDRLAKTVSPVGSGSLPIRSFIGPLQASDSQNPNTWYPTNPQKKVTAVVNSYSLSIPSLKISHANVIIAGDDLMVSLVHYGGTPVPGQYGNAVIFGHSTLSQFYDPKNYKSIFSILPSIKVGDKIYATYDGIEYTYEVYDMIVVDPTDLSPLEQKFDDSYMTLVTCVPPGTVWKRLNVKARIIKNS